MQRITVSIDDDLAKLFDRLLEKRGYRTRSEAVRDMIRRELADESMLTGDGECVAVVSYGYDHHQRQLSKRMVGHQHDHGQLVVSNMHVHVTESKCVEAVVVRGPYEGVRKISEGLVAETGIEHGKINYIPVRHDHEHGHPHGHDH